MASSSASGLVFVSDPYILTYKTCKLTIFTGQIDREGNARKVVNCSCVVVKDWGEESSERSVLLNYFQTEQ